MSEIDFEIKPTPDCEEETEESFVKRCMGDDEAVSDYPDPAQREAVCHSLWEQECGSKQMSECWEILARSIENDKKSS